MSAASRTVVVLLATTLLAGCRVGLAVPDFRPATHPAGVACQFQTLERTRFEAELLAVEEAALLLLRADPVAVVRLPFDHDSPRQVRATQRRHALQAGLRPHADEPRSAA